MRAILARARPHSTRCHPQRTGQQQPRIWGPAALLERPHLLDGDRQRHVQPARRELAGDEQLGETGYRLLVTGYW